MRRRLDSFSFYVIIVIVVALIPIIVSAAISFNDHTIVATVTDKERIVQGGGDSVSSYYLIFCKDSDGNYYELKNEDNIFRLKFDSSRFYNQIEEDETYEFTVVGYRVPFLSWYENIISFERV